MRNIRRLCLLLSFAALLGIITTQIPTLPPDSLVFPKTATSALWLGFILANNLLILLLVRRK